MKPSEYIEQHGWCQGELEDDYGRVCIEGSIVRVCDGIEDTAKKDEAIGAIERKILAAIPESVCVLWKWNDEPGRTQAEVLKLLRSVGE